MFSREENVANRCLSEEVQQYLSERAQGAQRKAADETDSIS